MARLNLKLLGSMQVTLDGNLIKGFDSIKTRALLAYLAFEKAQPQSRETLAELLWPGQPEGPARHSLSQALSNLRLTIGDRHPTRERSPNEQTERREPFLLITTHSIQFNTQGDSSSDTARFLELLAGCGANDHPSPASCQACMERYREAVTIYRGEFLADLYLKDCILFGEWMTVIRERLHREALKALDCLTEFHDQRGELELAISYARRQVALNPLWEPAQRSLMRVLAQDGQRSAALAQYDDLKYRLGAELSAQPERETTALYERLRAEAESAEVLGVLPQPLTPFVGRQAELLELNSLLRDPACRLISVLGPGGVGKTRLALEAARALRYYFTHGVYLVPLSALDSPDALLPAMAEALGFEFSAGEDPKHQLRAYLGAHRLLLLLDSFETVLEAAPLVAELLRASSTSKALVTTRARLGLKGEQVFPLAGMKYPAPGPDYDPQAFNAVALFLSAARRVNPVFQPSEADLGHIARLCELVEGMPLGIMLASAWVGQFAPAEIAQQVERGLDFLNVDWGDVPERQRSLRATFDYSWDLLPQNEQEALAGLSVFRGGFTLQAAGHVTNCTARELQDLMGKSLLQRTPTGRFEVHDLIRQYAAERLAQRRSVELAIRDRHRAYYLNLVENAEADLVTARQEKSLKILDSERENLNRAWRWAVDGELVDLIHGTINGLCSYYDLRHRYQEGLRACRLAAEKMGAEAASDGRFRTRIRAMVWELRFNRILRRHDIMQSLWEQLEVHLDEAEADGLDVRWERALALNEAMPNREQLSEQQDRLQRSLDLFQELGEPSWAAKVLGNLGVDLNQQGDYLSAIEMLEDSLAIRRMLGEPRGIAVSLRQLSHTHVQQGHLARALSLMEEAAELYRSLGTTYGEATAARHLGIIYTWHGRFAEACALLEQSRPLLQHLGLHFNQLVAYLALGTGKMHLGAYPSARTNLKIALTFASQRGLQRELAFSLAGLGCLDLVEGEPGEALERIQQGVDIYRKLDFIIELNWSLCCLGLVRRELGDEQEARKAVCEGLRLVERQGGGHLALTVGIPLAALLLLDEGELETAIETWTLACRLPVVANSRWTEQVAGGHIREMTRSVPPELRQAAERRGKKRDPFQSAGWLLETLACELR